MMLNFVCLVLTAATLLCGTPLAQASSDHYKDLRMECSAGGLMSLHFSSTYRNLNNYDVQISCGGCNVDSRSVWSCPAPANGEVATCSAVLTEVRPSVKVTVILRRKASPPNLVAGGWATLQEATCDGYTDFKVVCGQDGHTYASWYHSPHFAGYYFEQRDPYSSARHLSVTGDLNGCPDDRCTYLVAGAATGSNQPASVSYHLRSSAFAPTRVARPPAGGCHPYNDLITRCTTGAVLEASWTHTGDFKAYELKAKTDLGMELTAKCTLPLTQAQKDAIAAAEAAAKAAAEAAAKAAKAAKKLGKKAGKWSKGGGKKLGRSVHGEDETAPTRRRSLFALAGRAAQRRRRSSSDETSRCQCSDGGSSGPVCSFDLTKLAVAGGFTPDSKDIFSYTLRGQGILGSWHHTQHASGDDHDPLCRSDPGRVEVLCDRRHAVLEWPHADSGLAKAYEVLVIRHSDPGCAARFIYNRVTKSFKAVKDAVKKAIKKVGKYVGRRRFIRRDRGGGRATVQQHEQQQHEQQQQQQQQVERRAAWRDYQDDARVAMNAAGAQAQEINEECLETRKKVACVFDEADMGQFAGEDGTFLCECAGGSCSLEMERFFGAEASNQYHYVKITPVGPAGPLPNVLFSESEPRCPPNPIGDLQIELREDYDYADGSGAAEDMEAVRVFAVSFTLHNSKGEAIKNRAFSAKFDFSGLDAQRTVVTEVTADGHHRHDATHLQPITFTSDFEGEVEIMVRADDVVAPLLFVDVRAWHNGGAQWRMIHVDEQTHEEMQTVEPAEMLHGRPGGQQPLFGHNGASAEEAGSAADGMNQLMGTVETSGMEERRRRRRRGLPGRAADAYPHAAALRVRQAREVPADERDVAAFVRAQRRLAVRDPATGAPRFEPFTIVPRHDRATAATALAREHACARVAEAEAEANADGKQQQQQEHDRVATEARTRFCRRSAREADGTAAAAEEEEAVLRGQFQVLAGATVFQHVMTAAAAVAAAGERGSSLRRRRQLGVGRRRAPRLRAARTVARRGAKKWAKKTGKKLSKGAKDAYSYVSSVGKSFISAVDKAAKHLDDAVKNGVKALGVKDLAQSLAKRVVNGVDCLVEGVVASIPNDVIDALVSIAENAVYLITNPMNVAQRLASFGAALVQIVGSVVMTVLQVIADGIVTCVTGMIDAVNQLVNFVVKLVELVGAMLKALIEFLCMLFAWDDYLYSMRVIRATMRSAFAFVPPFLRTLDLQGILGAQAGAWAPKIVEAVPDINLNPAGLDTLSSASKYVFKLVKKAIDLVMSAFNSIMTAIFDALGLDTVMDVDALLAVVEEVGGLVGYVTGFPDITTRGIAERMVDVVIAAAAALGAVMDTGNALLATIFDLVDTGLNAHINIPILADVFKLITGEKLTIITCLSLAAAFPFTIMSKLFGRTPFKRAQAEDAEARRGIGFFGIDPESLAHSLNNAATRRRHGRTAPGAVAGSRLRRDYGSKQYWQDVQLSLSWVAFPIGMVATVCKEGDAEPCSALADTITFAVNPPILSWDSLGSNVANQLDTSMWVLSMLPPLSFVGLVIGGWDSVGILDFIYVASNLLQVALGIGWIAETDKIRENNTGVYHEQRASDAMKTLNVFVSFIGSCLDASNNDKASIVSIVIQVAAALGSLIADTVLVCTMSKKNLLD